MELKSCSNSSGYNVEGLNPRTDFSNSKLLDDTKSCLSENYICSKSDLDVELEKCYKILGSESLVELKSCSSPIECSVEGLVQGTDFELSEDTKNNFCSKSGLDREFEKCYEVLDLEQPVEIKNCSDLSKYNMQDFIPKTDFECSRSEQRPNSPSVMNNSDNLNMDEISHKSLENFDQLSPKIDSDVSPQETQNLKSQAELEMNKLHIWNLKYDLKSFNKFSNLEEKSDVVKSNTQSSNNLGLKKSKSSSSLDSQTFNADNSNNDFDVKNTKEILSSEDKILINETEYLSKESKFDAPLNGNKISNGTVNLLDSQTSNSENANYDFVKNKNEIVTPDHKILINETECPSKETKSDAFLHSKTSYKAVNTLDSQSFNDDVANNDFDGKNRCNISSCNKILKKKIEYPSKESKADAFLNNSKTSNKTINTNTLDPQTFNEDVVNNDFGGKNMSNISSCNKILKKKTECPSKKFKSDATLNDDKTSNETVTLKREILNNDDLKKGEIKDYLEEEKDDLINPEWDAIKKLTTNEQRYQQVRKCWESRKIPDPNKNLTYHSYRKKLFLSRHPEPRTVTKQKRQASTQLSGKSAKRHCTFFLDKEIDSIERTKEKEKQAIINEMNDKISSIGYEDSRWNRAAPYHHKFNSRVSIIKNEYFKIADTCEDKFSDQISSLNERRNEVLQFYGFYKGLNDSNKDPTQLTESQFQELNEIEDVYRQFGIYYKD